MLKTTLRTLALSAVAAAALTACGGSSSSSTAVAATSKASFCRDNAALDKATADARTAPELLAALVAHQSTVTDFGKVAPAAVSANAQLLVTGATAAIKAKSADAFATAKFVTAGKSVDAYCGQKADGSPA